MITTIKIAINKVYLDKRGLQADEKSAKMLLIREPERLKIKEALREPKWKENEEKELVLMNEIETNVQHSRNYQTTLI